MDSQLTDQTCGTVSLGDGRIVRRLGFGAMRLTGEGAWGPPAVPEAARAVLKRTLELGVNIIDTADAYGPAVNEEYIADALYPYPEELVLATKAGMVRGGPGRWSQNGRPEHIKEACEASLLRLRVETIDLYQFHHPDPDVPFAESVGAFAELRAAGKIRAVGLSNIDVPQLREAQEIVPIASVQNRYNVGDRGSEAVLRACETDSIAFLPFFPLAAGTFSAGAAALGAVGAAHGVSQNAVALAWLLQRSPVMVPIPGTSKVDHLEENVAAASLRLTDTDLERLDGVDPALSADSEQLSKPLSEKARASVREQAGIFRRMWNRLTN